MAAVRPRLLTPLICVLGLAWAVSEPALAAPEDDKPAAPGGSEPSGEAKAPKSAERSPKAPEITVPLNLALIARLSVNRLSGPNVHNFVSLGLISNESARLTGLQLGLGASGVGRAMTGVQVGGLVSGAGADVAGMQLGGLVSGAGGDVSGLQVGGLVSGAGGQLRGLQLSLLVSGAGGKVRGAQVAGLVSGAGGRVDGAQVAGLVSGASELDGLQLSAVLNGAGEYRGLQLAGVMNATGRGSGVQLAPGNYAKQSLRGAQIGLVNVGGEVRGAQIGLVNIACRVHGAQIGLVNVSSAADGVLVGPVSYVSSAAKSFEVWTSPLSPLSVAWRLGRGRVYSLLAAGAQPFADTPRLSLGAGTGVELRRWDAISLESDALLHYLLYDYDPSGTDAWVGQLRAKLLYRVRTGLTLLGGVSLNAAVSDETESEELAFALDGAFESGDTTVRIWPSLFAGIRL